MQWLSVNRAKSFGSFLTQEKKSGNNLITRAFPFRYSKTWKVNFIVYLIKFIFFSCFKINPLNPKIKI